MVTGETIRTFTDSKSAFSSILNDKKVQVGKDQEKAQSEKDSHSNNRGGKDESLL